MELAQCQWKAHDGQQPDETLEKTTGIRPDVLGEIRELAQKYRVKKVLLFGSRARGDYRKTSDIVNLDQDMQPELKSSIQREGKVIYQKSIFIKCSVT
ncbi:hypothetical protein HNP82_001519 [Catenibacillus scindens]|uniref:Polymerase nucleotidyl transferase domain-containing protein n=1 Tax=Catenibacillus scindens TaxID=673271 RepID=A0A7W8H9Q3_9FIRM|nr:hypothetical protein [Catenibacillus scindens]